MVIISIFIFMHYIPIIGIYIIGTIIFVAFYMVYIIQIIEQKWLKYVNKCHEYDNIFQNIMLNIWNIKYNSLEKIAKQKLQHAYKAKNKAYLEFKNMDFRASNIPEMIFNGVIFMNLYFIIKNNKMKLATRIFLMLQLFQLNKYLRDLGDLIIYKYQNIRFIEKICPIWFLKPKKNEQLLEIPNIHSIEFRNVYYSHDENMPILQKFNLKIMKNEQISLRGHSGKGKSTIINLLCRLYEIDRGQILINGIDIRNIKLESLRQHISVVPQTIILFDSSIQYNIILDAELNQKRLNELVKQLKLPTDLKRNARQLSYGQKQRILIARSLYNINKSVYIFDEALSSIDQKTSGSINKMILDFLRKNGKIGIFISHNKKYETQRGRIVDL